jgi:hypothetical protein
MATKTTASLGVFNIAGGTITQTSADFTNVSYRGVKVVLDTTVIGTGSVTVTIQGKDRASGKYYTLLAGAAVVTNVTNVYTVFPGAPVAANVSANDQLPEVWRIVVTANNANPATYTVGAALLP